MEPRIEIRRCYNEKTTIRHHEGILIKGNKEVAHFDIYAPNSFEAAKDLHNYIDVNFRPSKIEKTMQKIEIKA